MKQISTKHSLFSLFVVLLISACTTTKDIVKSPPKVDTQKNLDNTVMKKYMNTITAEDAKKHLYTVASDAFEGRNTASRGLKLAADYITNFYHSNGLVGPVKGKANPYLQPIPFYEKKVNKAEISGNGISLEHNKDFATLNSSNFDKTVELVFGGYGADLADYNDLASLDLKGKALVLFTGEPMDSEGNRVLDKNQADFLTTEKLRDLGITDLFLTTPRQGMWDAQAPYLSYTTEILKPVHTMDETELNRDKSYNRFLISPAKVAGLLGLSPDEFSSKIQANLDAKKPTGGLFAPKEINMSVSQSESEITSNNLAAYLEGTDLKNEVIVISSHYDHVGVMNGKIHNGADDDGSGTVGVMEIAEAFAKATKEGFRPRRSILFLNVTGEEKGLFGSAYYADVAPIFPLANTTTNLNIDMIGRVDPKHEGGGDYVYIIGSDMLSTDLHKVHEEVAKENFPNFELDYLYNGKDHPERFYYRSDHYNFAKNGIPVIFYFNGTHADYHQPTDTPEKIDYNMLAKRAQLVFATAWELANIDKRPVVDKSDK